MTYGLRLTIAAYRDLLRLEDFLTQRSGPAARRALDSIEAALASLRTMPERGRSRGDGRRELVIPFGSYAYLALYRVTAEAVVILRILHSKERR